MEMLFASDTTIAISIAKLKSWFKKMFCLALVPVDDQADRLSVARGMNIHKATHNLRKI